MPGPSLFTRTGRIKPGTTEHLVLLAARPTGRIEATALLERFGYYPNKAVCDLVNAGYLDRHGLKDTVFSMTALGRDKCPPRRDIPLIIPSA